MKFLICIVSLFFTSITCLSQDSSPAMASKPPIDSSVYGKWPFVEHATISNDGKFATYIIENRPVNGRTLVILSTEITWKMEMQVPDGYDFTPDSRKFIFTLSKDSIGIITLDKGTIEYLSNVSALNVIKNKTGEWIAYMGAESVLVLRDIMTRKMYRFPAVDNYTVSEDGKVVIVQNNVENNEEDMFHLTWVNLDEGKQFAFWNGRRASDVVLDPHHTQVAFLVEKEGNKSIEKTVWHYKLGLDSAVRIDIKRIPDLDSCFKLEQIQSFSKNGDRLFFTLKKPEQVLKPAADAVQVDVWSYRDTKLQSQQLQESNNEPSEMCSAVFNFDNNRSFVWKMSNETSYEKSDEMAIVNTQVGDADASEANWNPACEHSFFLVSTKNGERKRIAQKSNFYFNLSPDGQYAIYYDQKQRNYFCYTARTGLIRNMTKTIKTDWTEYDNDHPDAVYAVNALEGWSNDDSSVFLHDQYDIWKVSLSGKELPVNITNGYGRKHNMVLSLTGGGGRSVRISGKDTLILVAFNRNTKDNGFYSKRVDEKGDPKLLTMGPYVYEVPGNNPDVFGQTPLKAGNAVAYVVRRMSAGESPNYFFTKDFLTFRPLSHIYPESDYNWLKTELVSWPTLNGSLSQGILYKPENFNPKKKYPIIFYYYERLSDRLNVYIQPEESGGNMNIPWYVSNGYLVFTPDIHYKIGKTGESVVNSVLSAANYLSHKPWINKDRMGIQGHSFGGYETDYLVTHSHIFAAAVAASGYADLVSGYNSLAGNGSSLQVMYEWTQFRIGATLWQHPELYIANSPVFTLDSVTTPLLMMHTRDDGVYPFSNAVEFFTGLRRLGKKVWMLQYDGNNHFLDGRAAADFTIRMQQFFGYYLKGAPMPKWMVQGIPARLKGIDSGLELTGHEIKKQGANGKH